jgi:hypothetical protein
MREYMERCNKQPIKRKYPLMKAQFIFNKVV